MTPKVSNRHDVIKITARLSVAMHGGPNDTEWVQIATRWYNDPRVHAIVKKKDYDLDTTHYPWKAAMRLQPPGPGYDPTATYFQLRVAFEIPQVRNQEITIKGEALWHVDARVTYLDEFNAPSVEVTQQQVDQGVAHLQGATPHIEQIKVEKLEPADWFYYGLSAIDYSSWAWSKIPVGLVLPAGTLHTPPNGPAAAYVDITALVIGTFVITPIKTDTLDCDNSLAWLGL